MGKRIISLCLVFAVFFAIAACNSGGETISELDEYKAAAKAELTLYFDGLNENDYSAGDWQNIGKIFSLGIAAIDAAANTNGVDTFASTTKAQIEKVQKQRPIGILTEDDFELTYYVKNLLAEYSSEIEIGISLKNKSGMDIYISYHNSPIGYGTMPNWYGNDDSGSAGLGPFKIIFFGKNATISEKHIVKVKDLIPGNYELWISCSFYYDVFSSDKWTWNQYEENVMQIFYMVPVKIYSL